jgi:hypothetical protein
MGESRLHRQAKDLVSDMIKRGPGYLIVSHEVGMRWESTRVDVSDMEVITECGYPIAEEVPDFHYYCAVHGFYPEMIFDVGLARAGKVLVAIEILKSHWLDDKKRKKIRKSGVVVIAADAKTNDWSVDNERIEAREFIYPPDSKLIAPILVGAACK